MTAVRRIIVAPANAGLVAGDLKSIEPRVHALLAGETDLLERFGAGEDVYRWFIVGVVGSETARSYRWLGKEAILGLGYGMGRIKFGDRVRASGLDVDDELIDRAYQAHRELFPDLHRIRYRYMDAFTDASCGHVVDVGMCRFRPVVPLCTAEGRNGVAVELPSGRALFYRAVEWRVGQTPWGEIRDEPYFVRRLQLPGEGEATKGHERLGAHQLVENIVQAVARDVLMYQLLELEDEGVHVILTVHDELIALAPDCTCGSNDPAAEHGELCSWANVRNAVEQHMSRVPASLPRLRDLPLACEIAPTVFHTYGK